MGGCVLDTNECVLDTSGCVCVLYTRVCMCGRDGRESQKLAQAVTTATLPADDGVSDTARATGYDCYFSFDDSHEASFLSFVHPPF